MSAAQASATAPDARLARRLVLAWAAVVLVFAVLPTHQALEATVGEGETLTTQVGHFVEFAVLAALTARWLGTRPGRRGARLTRRIAIAAWAGTVAYGGLIEVMQLPLAYRDGQLSDFAIDAAGALTGLLVLSGLQNLQEWAGRRRAR